MNQRRLFFFIQYVGNALVIAALILLLYGLAWNHSTHRYLDGFADGIIPREGSPEEKTNTLLNWLQHVPQRTDTIVTGSSGLRDPVNIVQNARLLKYCGSATNAFMNLLDIDDVRTRRLLLLDESGSAKHVVVEVQWGTRWVVVDPSFGRVFRNRSGRALSKEELRDPKVFREAISRIPGYKPSYAFERTAHINLKRIPLLGDLLRPALDRLSPRWEETINWGYLPENPSLWPILVSLPLLLLGISIRLVVDRQRRDRQSLETVRSSERLIRAGRTHLSRPA